MKIKTKILTAYLKKVSMTDSQQINEVLMHFDKDGLKVDANSPAKQSRVMGWLKKDSFKEYESIGKVGLNDLVVVTKVLGRFSDLITLTKEGNLLSIKGKGKSVDVELVSEKFIGEDKGAPDLTEFVDTFEITAKKLQEIFIDVQTNKDAQIIFESVPKGIIITNTGKYKFTYNLDAPNCKGGAKVKFGEPLIHAVNNLDGGLEISLGVDYPAKVIEKTEESVVTFIIAPRVDEE